VKPVEPLKVFPSELSPRRLAAATLFFVLLGLAVRLVRYLLCFPLWPDEGFLAANFVSGEFGAVLGPLAYHQVAPLYFLWLEVLAVRLLGFSEYALRLFPLICGLFGVLVFRRLAGLVCRGLPLLLSVGLFAVSYYPVRHSVEVKPYSVDLAVSLLLLVLAAAWLRRPERRAPLWGLVLFCPVAVGLSFPAAFTAGGVAAVLLPLVWRDGPSRRAWFFLLAGLIAGFLLVFTLSTGPQLERERWLREADPATSSFNRDQAWVRTFPPLGEPLRLLPWLLRIHTGLMFAYPNGGHNGGSSLTFLLFLIGAVVLWRRGRRRFLALFLVPFALTFVAAALRRYPYGYSARFNLYLAPSICLLAGLGAARLLVAIPSRAWHRGVLWAFLGLLALAGLATAAIDISRPYKNIEDVRSRDFARGFWRNRPGEARTVCVYRDLGLEFFPRLFEWGHSSRYLCHQAVFRGPPGAPVHPGGGEPLRCVVFSVPSEYEPYAVRDDDAWNAWLREMSVGYELIGHRCYEVNPGVPSHHETYDVYEFVPRS